MLEGDEPETEYAESETDIDYAEGETAGEDIHHGGETNRVLGGYKATLKSMYL